MKHIGTCLIALLFLNGCSGASSSDAELKTEIQGLKKLVGRLHNQVEASREQIRNTNIALFKLQTQAVKTDDSVVLDPTSTTYSSINTGSGTLLISIAKVEPYLDGFKLYLQIGNPMAMTYSGFDLTIKHAEEFDAEKRLDKYDEWEKSVKEKQYKLTNQLLPGRWNNVEIVISPAKPSEIKYLEVSIDTGSVILTATPN